MPFSSAYICHSKSRAVVYLLDRDDSLDRKFITHIFVNRPKSVTIRKIRTFM